MTDPGPAFPHEVWIGTGADGRYVHRPGMSLRDYFAAAALTGFYASGKFHKAEFANAAECAYRAADEMILEREK